MIRILLFLFVAALTARASDPINAPVSGASVAVTQPHVVAELIPEKTTIEPGTPFDIALHLHADPGWHTYWVNPGDAGLATSIKWTLPPGFTAGPIQWPTPEKHDMGGIMTYGYAGDVYLLATITPPKSDLPQHFDIKAKVSWLVCEEECIPGKADLTLSLDSGLLNLRLPIDNTDFFAQARERMPAPNTLWTVTGAYAANNLVLTFRESISAPISSQHLDFFPEQANVLSTINDGFSSGSPKGHPDFLVNGIPFQFNWSLPLQQNGEKPDKLSGVLVSDQPLIGKAKAVYISEFPVSKVAGAVPSGGSAPSSGSPQATVAAAVSPSGTPDNLLSGSRSASGATGGSPQTSATPENASTAPPLGTPASPAIPPTLLAVLGAAFVGGLILNLMPCVLPVLSLKVFSLMKHAGENPKTAWLQGFAFTVGVVLSFWILAGLLLALRSAGNHLGWGFQMQSPGFVLGLILLFFLLALNLFGVFELGSSLVGLDAKATGHLGGLASSFGNGALATLAATPCTAPFMGSALGFAAQQPAIISLLIFTCLALGMAAPYLLLTIFPGALRFVPKPGAWMEAFKQFMGFLLMATVIFLVYVFGALVGEEQIPWLLLALLIAGVGAWVYGKWCTPINSGPVRLIAVILTVGLVGFAVFWGVSIAEASPTVASFDVAQDRLRSTATTEGEWQPWTPDAVNATLDRGQPVFVDFTAAWCLSCKVNEKVALDTDAVKKAFTDKNVALLKADWTHSDPAISKALQQFNRDGVPLYLLYSPRNKDTPQILPEVLTPGIVLDALNKL